MWTSCTACRCTWGGCGRRSHVIIPERPCGCGEIGRRAGFRFQFPRGSVGSSPIIRTIGTDSDGSRRLEPVAGRSGSYSACAHLLLVAVIVILVMGFVPFMVVFDLALIAIPVTLMVELSIMGRRHPV